MKKIIKDVFGFFGIFIKNIIHVVTRQPCPFCGSEDVVYSDECTVGAHERSSAQDYNGVFTTIPKTCWVCKSCDKTFFKT